MSTTTEAVADLYAVAHHIWMRLFGAATSVYDTAVSWQTALSVSRRVEDPVENRIARIEGPLSERVAARPPVDVSRDAGRVIFFCGQGDGRERVAGHVAFEVDERTNWVLNRRFTEMDTAIIRRIREVLQ